MDRQQEQFLAKEGDFPTLIMRLRGPLNIATIIEMVKNDKEFVFILKKMFTKRVISKISRRTRLQSKSSYWFLYRRCLVSGTMAKRVIRQNELRENNEKLNRIITKTFPNRFMNEAMRYGLLHEENALKALLDLFKTEHRKPKIDAHGVILYDKAPFVGASVDGVLSCECCKKSILIEVKCPFHLKDTGIENWSILEYFDKDQNLKRNHTYFNQINLYQGILGIQDAFFIVYAKGKIIIKEIKFDESFFNYQIKNISQYYMDFYLPTVIGKKI